jgi:hypothetical protein
MNIKVLGTILLSVMAASTQDKKILHLGRFRAAMLLFLIINRGSE